jgi:hypothetical protein
MKDSVKRKLIHFYTTHIDTDEAFSLSIGLTREECIDSISNCNLICKYSRLCLKNGNIIHGDYCAEFNRPVARNRLENMVLCEQEVDLNAHDLEAIPEFESNFFFI